MIRHRNQVFPEIKLAWGSYAISQDGITGPAWPRELVPWDINTELLISNHINLVVLTPHKTDNRRKKVMPKGSDEWMAKSVAHPGQVPYPVRRADTLWHYWQNSPRGDILYSYLRSAFFQRTKTMMDQIESGKKKFHNRANLDVPDQTQRWNAGREHLCTAWINNAKEWYSGDDFEYVSDPLNFHKVLKTLWRVRYPNLMKDIIKN